MLPLLRRFRAIAPVTLALVAAPFVHGCGDDGTGASADDVTDVKNSSVKNQAIGNCWVYATIGWAESLRLTHSGEELNLSESWVSYWHWYEQIAGGPPDETQVAMLDRAGSSGGQIGTGGWWGVGVELMRRYGVLSEGAFIPQDAEAARSSRQSSALSAINTSLKSGVLSDAAKRRDRKVVRAELDKAWGLTPEVSAMLDAAYGADVTRTFSKGKATIPSGASLRVVSDIEVGKGISLGDAIGEPASRYDVKKRTGKYAWNEVSYPSSAKDRRALLGRMQEAMHDGMPVILTWFVDFAAQKGTSFEAPPTTPGRQGGHMTVVEDYQVSNVPGFGTLAAGTLVTDPAALQAALDPSATIDFLRIKNSWGTSLAPTNASDDLRGYHDLYMAYLNGPLTKCTEKDGDKCGIKSQTAGLWGLTLPPAAFLTDRKGVEGACLDPCTVGPARTPDCGECEAVICDDDPYCCNTAWDATCAESASTVCDVTCGG